jgi:hypothetical protein
MAMVLVTACQRPKPAPSVIEEAPGLAQTVAMGNLEHAKQLGKGFYAVEDGAWRWTQGKFALQLRPPLQAEARGATLVVKGTIPPAVIEKLKDVTVSTVVNGVRLKTTNFARAGAMTLRLDVPANAFRGETAAVEFILDKVLPPRPDDQRELGLIVSSIGFERKT